VSAKRWAVSDCATAGELARPLGGAAGANKANHAAASAIVARQFRYNFRVFIGSPLLGPKFRGAHSFIHRIVPQINEIGEVRLKKAAYLNSLVDIFPTKCSLVDILPMT
jgi:hypothetical protein